jgi:hypothetical protein
MQTKSPCFSFSSIKTIPAVLIGIEEYAEALKEAFLKVASEHGYVYKPRQYDWSGYILLLFRDIISERLLWVNPTNLLRTELEAEFKWYNQYMDTPECVTFLPLFDEIELAINSFLDNYIPNRTYDIWIVKRFVDDSIVLLHGEDYRILAWNKAVKDKVLEHPRRGTEWGALSYTTLEKYYSSLEATELKTKT